MCRTRRSASPRSRRRRSRQRRAKRQRGGRVCAEHVLQRVQREKAEQRAVPGRRLRPANPGVTTYIDGVPQLNTNSSSIELLDVDQIEFVRGPQSALFGRNALGGVINIGARARPSTAGRGVPRAVRQLRHGRRPRVRLGSPRREPLALGFSCGYSRRDGFTENAVTGNDLDSRSASFAKTQLLWTPSSNWEARFILSTERARDGDYALNDLASLRANPFDASRDYRRVHPSRHLSPTVICTAPAGRSTSTSTTGFVSWETSDRNGSRLLAAAARHPRQRRRGPPVHPGISCGVVARRVHGRGGLRHHALAGRPVPVHAGLRSGSGEQLFAVCAVGVRPFP